MYAVRNLPIRPVTADSSIVLPLGALLVLPRHAVGPARGPFNLPGAAQRLLGDWRRVERILKPRIWASSWHPADAERFVHRAVPLPRASAPEFMLERLPLSSLPDLESRGPITEIQEYAIVQWYARTFRTYGTGPRSTVLSRDAWIRHDDEVWRAGELRDWLVLCGARLFILQPFAGTEWLASEALESAKRLAEFIVGAGGPAVLVVSGYPFATWPYLLDLYAGILHNQPLSQAASTQDDSLDVTLVLGEGADDLLRLDPMMDSIASSLKNYRQMAVRPTITLQNHIDYLHSDTKKQFETHLRTLNDLQSDIELNQSKLHDLRQQPWHREHEGVIPLSEVDQSLSEIAAAAGPITGEGAYLEKYDALEEEIRQAAASAPRVLNAGFADPNAEGRVLNANTPLIAGQEYDLLVDIGPRWDKTASLVSGYAEFPERALDPEGYQHEIEVLFASSDFEPRLRSARLLLPNRTGRSVPLIEGKSANKPGPVALRLRAPEKKPESSAPLAARGRLSLYYRGNLLQSAAVLAWIAASSDEKVDGRHSIEVDYVLTSTFQELEEHFATRRLKFTADDENDQHAIAVNLTLNGNGSDSHRILITSGIKGTAGTSAPPPAFIPYNPSSAAETLKGIRDTLLDCFYERDAKGVPQIDKNALRPDNSKSRDQFQWDLWKLAEKGKLLFNMITRDPNVEGDQLDGPAYAQALRSALKSRSIIQVARTGAAEYAFPWTLVYDIPLPGPNYEFCRVLNEWNPQGRRQNALEYLECPCVNEAWHQRNIICPFGFWGLKHIIEQPVSALRQKNGAWVLQDVASRFGSDHGIEMCIGITRDPHLDQRLIKLHVDKLKENTRLSFLQGTPADTVLDMQKLLQTPSIVYLLCHGKLNNEKREAYLGVGTPDDRYHQIYADAIQDWTDTPEPPNLANWRSLRPFVFINGCETLQLKPEEALPFFAAFGRAGASGVLGTEVSIKLPLAVEVGKSILEGIVGGSAAGQVLRETRWKLANKGNLLGLAYTLYARSDLQIASMPEATPATETAPEWTPIAPSAETIAGSGATLIAGTG